MNGYVSAEIDRAIATIFAALSSGRLTVNALDDGSGVVLDVDREQLLTMNQTGLFIMRAIADGYSNEDRLTASLIEEFEVDADNARRDIKTFLGRVLNAME